MDPIILDFEQQRAQHLLNKTKLRAILDGQWVAGSSICTHRECNTGKWLYGYAMEAYAGIPQIAALERLHEQLHTAAITLLQQHRNHQDNEARRSLSEIEQTADRLDGLFEEVEKKIQEKNVAQKSRLAMPVSLPQSELLDLYRGIRQMDLRIRQQAVQLEKERKQADKKVHGLFDQAPVAVGIYRGPAFVVELANDRMLEYWGRTAEDVVNKPLFEALPEARNQGFEAIIDQVYRSGAPFVSVESPVSLMKNGQLHTIYVTLVFEPLREADGSISGVMGMAYDISDMVTARQKAEQSETKFRHIVQQAPVGITILRGPAFRVEMANEAYLELVDREEKAFVGFPLFDTLPEVRPVVEPLLSNVLATGIPYYGMEVEIPIFRHGRQITAYFNFVYQALYESDGSIGGIIVVVNEITEQVQAKHILQESEKEFRSLVAQSPIAMTILKGRDMVIEMANNTLLQNIWHKDLQEVQGKKITDVFPELNGQKYPELLEKVYVTGEAHREKESVAYIRGNNGLKQFFLDYEYAPLYAPDGGTIGVIITVNDVTEKVETRQRIAEDAARLRLATEGTQLGTWDLNLTNNVILHSPRLAEIFGFDKSAVISHQEMRNMIHPDDRKAIVEKAFELALKTGNYFYEARNVWPDQSVHWVRTFGKIFFDAQEQPVRMLGTIVDITEAKAAEEALKFSLERFRLLADSMPQQIWTGDAAGRLNYFNQSVYRQSGFSARQLEQEGWISIVHPDDRQKNIDNWMHSVQTGEDFILEHRFRQANGTYRWQLSRALAQKDAEGKILMWVGTSTDIHDQKMFSEDLELKVLDRTRELQKANEELEKMNRELASFAYVSSHDLQEPLRKIQIFASFLVQSEKEKLSEKGKDYLNRMENAAARMQQLIQDILAYSRNSNKAAPFEPTPLDDVLQHVKDELKELIAEKKVAIDAGPLPVISGIRFQLHQLFINLVSNSIKFSRSGIAPHIVIRARRVKGNSIPDKAAVPGKWYHYIALSDNGIGFSQEYSSRIFEVFQRLHGRKEFEGTGIGLAICKRIVENHLGIILATGETGKGAGFHIYLPE